MEVKKAKLKRKISVRKTLLGIPVGESREIFRRDISCGSIRSAIRELSKAGYKYQLSDRLIGSTIVTRIL